MRKGSRAKVMEPSPDADERALDKKKREKMRREKHSKLKHKNEGEDLDSKLASTIKTKKNQFRRKGESEKRIQMDKAAEKLKNVGTEGFTAGRFRLDDSNPSKKRN